MEEECNLRELQLTMLRHPPGHGGHYMIKVSPPPMYGKSLTAKLIGEKCPDIMVVDKYNSNLKGKSLLGNYRLSEENNKD